MEAKEQWALVDKYRRELERDDDSAQWCDLEGDWQRLDIAHDHFLNRKGADFSQYVLPSIVWWIEEIGTYPPPEMLLALCDMFKRYMEAAGTLTLEEVMFGRPRQRSGTYAARRAKRDFRTEIAFVLAFRGGKSRGMSDSAAAEHAQADVERQYGKCPDAETMLKRMRRRCARTN